MKSNIINIIGVHQKIEGYPNVLFLLSKLEQTGKLKYKEYNKPMWSEGLFAKKTNFSKIKNLFKAFNSHLCVLYYIYKTPNLKYVYIPYPAIFLASVLSVYPKKKKPTFLVIDAFISIYDTAIIDRGLYSKTSFLARTLKKIETLAFKQASIVITDTYQNSVYYSKLFDLSFNKFIDIPLTIDEKSYNLTTLPKIKRNNLFNVIFIGTLIPLHGIETILKAAELLTNNKKIKFTIIGDGQMSNLVDKAINNGASNIKWIKKWQSSKDLVKYLSFSDLALGIFGSGEKTQRVCPFKLYAYLACGLPVITGKTKWTQAVLKKIDYLPFMTVDVADSVKLTQAILECYSSNILRNELSTNGYRFYKNQLANDNAINSFEKIFNEAQIIS